MYWKSNSCLRSGFINILFPHSVQQPCQFWYIVNAKINLFLLPYEPKDRIQLKVCSPFLHHQQNCWLGNTRSRSGIPVLGNVRSRSDVPVLSRVCIYSREGLDLRRVQCLCQTGRMEHIFRSCLWGFQTVPSLLARKHALELITARFSLFLSPKLALSHLIESGLLKTWSGTMGRSSEGHGICSGCVPIMQLNTTVSVGQCGRWDFICLCCILLSTTELLLGLGILFHTLVSFSLSFSGKKLMQQKRTLILIASEWLKISRTAALYDCIQTRVKRETDVHNWDFERKLLECLDGWRKPQK